MLKDNCLESVILVCCEWIGEDIVHFQYDVTRKGRLDGGKVNMLRCDTV